MQDLPPPKYLKVPPEEKDKKSLSDFLFISPFNNSLGQRGEEGRSVQSVTLQKGLDKFSKHAEIFQLLAFFPNPGIHCCS